MSGTTSPISSADDIRRELQTLRDEISRLGGQVTAQFGATGSQAINEITHALRRMNDVVATAGERSRGIAGEMAGNVSRAVEGNVRSLEGNVREHPFGAVAVALALGFLLGSLTMTRR